MSEHNQKFDTFQQWVNKAPSWLTRRGPDEQAMCFDAKGRRCQIGKDFMLARDEDAFPVRWFWPDDVPRLREINAELLAALKRAEQYLELTLMEEAAEDPHSTASRNVGDDLDVIRAAIARAEEDR